LILELWHSQGDQGAFGGVCGVFLGEFYLYHLVIFCHFSFMSVIFLVYFHDFLCFNLLAYTSVGLVHRSHFTSIASILLFFPISGHRFGDFPRMFVFPFAC